ncbi:hypothetical protein J2Z50_006619 [Ensifer mexicanus]|nr:hypothetical protein [Sinorhizobium mexicanum]
MAAVPGAELAASAVSFLAITVVVEPVSAPIGVKATGNGCFKRNSAEADHLLNDLRVRWREKMTNSSKRR